MSNKDLMDTEAGAPALGDQMKKIAEALDKSKTKTLAKSEPSESVEARKPRSTREMETRDADIAPLSWRPADVLPDPPQRNGWVHRWVRGSTLGKTDAINMARAMREHWRPCAASDYPEIVEQMPGGTSNDTIEFGGLILCRMPAEVAKQREAYYRSLSLRQIESVNERIREEQAQEGRVTYRNESVSRVNNLSPLRG